MKRFILLSLIVLFGGLLRFYQFDSVPPSLNWDEVSFGYNASSILATGRDEFGTFLPMYLRSFDDFKRPAYTYLTVASVAVFGLNDFAVRFPSAFLGTLSILLLYGLTKIVLKNDVIAYIAAFLLAIVPWHVQFSRAGFESNVAMFFTLLGVCAFFLGMQKSSWWLVLTAISFGVSMYAYLSQRIIVPVLLVTLFLLFNKKLFETLRMKRDKSIPVVIAALCIGLFFIGLAIDVKKPEGSIRFQATSVFNNSDEYGNTMKEMRDDAVLKINILRRVFHDNPITTSMGLVARGYLVHFSPDFLFFDIGAYDHKIPGVGLLYIWMAPFILIGGYFLVRQYPYSTSIPLLVWLFAVPIASSVTWQVPHALRTSEMVIPYMIIVAIGIFYTFKLLLKRKKIVYPLLCVFLFIVGISFVYFVHQYSIHMPIERSAEWVYGREEMVHFAVSHASSYEKVIASTELEWPHIFFLYYMRYDPKKYLAQGGTISGGWAEEGNRFDTYEFHHFDYLKDRKEGNYLFIGKPHEFPTTIKPLKIINYLDGKPAIYIVGS